MKRGKYCCFFCPAKDYSEKELGESCPKCGRSYGFILDEMPSTIGSYRVTKHLGRGFYGAAYVAERGAFGKQYVLKISPADFYSFFGKAPFEEETHLHATLAKGAEHVVGINDAFDEYVAFGDGTTKLNCHVTVLDYVEGDLLQDYIDGKVHADAATICQIAVDLLRTRGEFEAHHLNHNDLHAENLIVERLASQARRVDAIDPTIRVMAIDLGSISDASKSTHERLGDTYSIALHVDKLLERLLAKPTELEDRDFRTALALQSIVHGLLTDVQNVRLPNFEDLARQIREAYFRASQPWRPWSDPLTLKGFGDHYNAQTLVSWDVPRLLVDPQGRWLAEVTKPGPQIITGMRGCGKTMLLRALDLHARAARLSDQEKSEATTDVLQRIRADGFVGLFVSAQRLLDLRHAGTDVEHRLTRLFVNYSLQAARALMHLRDLDSEAVSLDAHIKLAEAVADHLGDAPELKRSLSLEDLERRLERIAVLSSRSASPYEVKQAPADVFPRLAEAFRSCSPLTSGSTVFFLLDDVSTRYLELERVGELLSHLLFQNPSCAFKFTSEWQTIELGLRSPGRIHPIRVDRDVAVFDLGADVYETIKGRGKDKGIDFVEQILAQRAEYHVAHPKYGPRELLGDVPLEQVANQIAGSSDTSRARKHAYRGLSCLTNVCVGDIGDVIKLYEQILQQASAGKAQISIPISDAIQSECFQALSSRRLYDLNRRGGYYKNHALAFAEAAHELLVRSAKKVPGGQRGLRQYSSIYVRVSADTPESLNEQIDKLRDLIDAGVFVYSGGAPRTKTKDSNPIQQFKLSYRKIYGLAAFIGLSDRDRFELTGDKLNNWLRGADKAVLLESQIGDEIDSYDEEVAPRAAAPSPSHSPSSATVVQDPQATLFGDQFEVEVIERARRVSGSQAKPIDALVRELKPGDLAGLGVQSILTGLGFEDRTLASNDVLSASLRAVDVQAVRYHLEGHGPVIEALWRDRGHTLTEIDYSQAMAGGFRLNGLSLVDVSGLSKPIIFTAIRRELRAKGRVIVFHMSAQTHYPLEGDLQELFAAEQAKDPIAFLESLSKVLKGEDGPYTEKKLLDEELDLSRSRALLAFASPKHERLFSLLDRREFDYVDVIVPTGDAPRARVANYAAEFACQSYQNAKVTPRATGPLVDLISYLDEQYLELYGVGGANVELGLTGSKIQAVAAAVLASRRKIAQAWYLSPAQFDQNKFTSGVREARIYDIRLGVSGS
jgi:serine/threonine protein kinase